MNVKAAVEEKVIPLLTELIQNRCVNDGTPESGNETESALSLKSFFDAYGIKSEIIAKNPRRGNLLVRIPGTDETAPSLMFMGHMDVVPANPEHWRYDPFAAEIHNGYLWGRGAIDMLNMTATQAVAVAELIHEKGPLRGDLSFLALADEEADGRLGARFLMEDHWDKVKTDYMLTELGGFFIRDDPVSGIGVTIGEKGVARLELTIKGTPGHGSMPYKSDNAVTKAADAAFKIASYRASPVFSPVYRDMASSMARSRFERSALLSRHRIDRAIDGIFERSRGAAKFLHAASRLTLSPNILNAGGKVNVIADRGIIELDVRLLPTDTIESVIQTIRSIIGERSEEFSIEVIEFFPSNLSPKDTPLMEALLRIAGTAYPEASFIPLFISSVTDGRYWRQKGTVVYGFTLFGEDMSIDAYSDMIHGNDECVSIASLEKSLEFFYHLPLEFFSLP
jgi:acetylornithine deacetylase/succinyl-diaminopimelate desuccinylase-like protein